MDRPIFASILDAILGDSPDYSSAGLGEAKSSGDDLLDLGLSETDDLPLPNATRAASVKSQRNEGNRSRVGNIGIRSNKIDWRGKAAKEVSDDDILTDVTADLSETADAAIDRKTISDSELTNYIDNLLNAGVEPIKVAARLDKLAELNIFNRTMGNDYLEGHSGTLGIAYLKPNTYMDSCTASYEKLTKQGSVIRAKSVKKISACEGCSYFKKEAKNCNLYHLPIVANQKELLPIINNLTAGAKNAKAELVKIANREYDRVPKEKKAEAVHRADQKVHIGGTAKVGKQVNFDVEEVTKLHTAGKSIQSIYEFGMKKAGQVAAAKTIKEFVAGLKRTNTKIALSQIDCSLLKSKLATSNAIVGDKRCASCTYRNGMHCGLTGGTLVGFPGMDKMATQHKTSATSPKDGHKMLNDYEMAHSLEVQDIEFLNPVRDDIEPGGKFDID